MSGLVALLLGRRTPGPTPEQEDEQERSRQEIERGGLPLNAQRRLAELRAGQTGFFTSDLSVNEFALVHRAGIEPLTQVMGSSIFKIGWRNLPQDTWYGMRRGGAGWGTFGGAGGGGAAWTAELESLSDAYNGARQRALDRLEQEAQLAGADAVVAVRLRTGGHAWADSDTTEFTAVGTAVRLPPELRTERPVITDLSGQEYWQLAQAGFRPVGVVGITTVMYVASSWADGQVLRSGNSLFSMAGRANQELGDFTRGFYEAREVAMSHLNVQANRLGAHGIVGVQIDEHTREREYEDANDNRHVDLIVTIHLLGTAITEGHRALGAPAVTTVMPLTPTSL